MTAPAEVELAVVELLDVESHLPTDEEQAALTLVTAWAAAVVRGDLVRQVLYAHAAGAHEPDRQAAVTLEEFALAAADELAEPVIRLLDQRFGRMHRLLHHALADGYAALGQLDLASEHRGAALACTDTPECVGRGTPPPGRGSRGDGDAP